MVTIAHLVAKRINDLPFIAEALAKRLINYGALADLLLPEIEKEMDKKIKHSAVMMALRRYADKLEQKFINPIHAPEFSDTELSLKSDIADIAVLKSATIYKKLQKLYDVVDFIKGDFLNIVHGNFEVMILTNRKYIDKFLKILGDEKVVRTKDKLSALSVKFSEKFYDIPGYLFTIMRTMAWQNVNIYETVSTYTEFTFILSQDEAIKGYNALYGLVSRNE